MFTENNMIAVSVDPVIFTMKDGELFVLLMKRKSGPYSGNFALPGGLMERTDVDLKAAISRVLKNKTGVTTNYTEQLESRTGHDPRGPTVSVAYMGLTDWKNVSGDVEWVRTHEARDIKLAFDHSKVFEIALDRLITKVNYSNLPVYFLPERFTIPELYELYHVLLGDNLSKSRFRSKIESVNGVVMTDEIRHRGAARPAALYKAPEDGVKFFKSNYLSK